MKARVIVKEAAGRQSGHATLAGTGGGGAKAALVAVLAGGAGVMSVGCRTKLAIAMARECSHLRWPSSWAMTACTCREESTAAVR